MFVAATKRPFRLNLDWRPFFEVADSELPFPEKLREYGRIAEAHFDQERFKDFCAEHLGDLDAVAWDYLGGERAHAAVRQKVAALFPEHEVEEFSERFWSSIQTWREDNQPAS